VDLDELIAREAIRDLVARYNANADAGRFAQVVALFTEDAVIELPDDRIEGRDAIDAMFRDVRSQVAASTPAGTTPHLRHFTGTLQIDVDGSDRATSRCYFQVLMAAGLDHWGRYVDEFVRVDGEWRIARRRVSVDGRRPDSPFSEPSVEGEPRR
jgi:ketosteroid isomerase-like protein